MPLSGAKVLKENPSWRTQATPAGAANAVPSVDAGMLSQPMVQAMHWVNILNAVLIGASASLGLPIIMAPGNMASRSQGFVALYMVGFACMLLAFELKLANYEAQMREQFGFMFTYKGRGAFLLFIGCLDFGIATPEHVTATYVGYYTMLNVVFNMYVLNTDEFQQAAVPGGGSAAAAPQYAAVGGAAYQNIGGEAAAEADKSEEYQKSLVDGV